MIHEQRPSRPHPEKLRRIALPPKLEPINPALVKHAHERAEAGENRVADAITRFAGSMLFVYLHVIWFASWIGFGVEDYPYGLLTMIVSLEAIFLSTFVMISQNRAETKQQVVAVSRKRKTMSSADKTVALTGVTGFIGSHVLTELQEHGHEVMVLVRDDSQADIVASRGATPTVVDLYDRQAVVSLLRKADSAIHTASPATRPAPTSTSRWPMQRSMHSPAPASRTSKSAVCGFTEPTPRSARSPHSIRRRWCRGGSRSSGACSAPAACAAS